MERSDVDDYVQFLSQGVDYLGFLDSKLRDLRGYAALANEFLQNADDAGANLVVFDFQAQALVIENDSLFSDCEQMKQPECPWKSSETNRRCDFHSFRLVAGREKRNRDETIGAFGVGFISAYQVTDEPELISGRRHWIIRPNRADNHRIEQKPAVQSRRTTFRLPWAFNAESPLRKALRVEPVNQDGIKRFREELEKALPSAILFLRHIDRIELRTNGVLGRSITRLREGERLVVQDGSKAELWQLFHGAFENEAESLRIDSRGRVEAKRKAKVTIAVPASVENRGGVLCAYLPTEHQTGLPFHINADFFPSSDRKRILLDSEDYQQEWNNAAIRAAAHALAANLLPLRDLLGHKGVWNVLQSVYRVALEAEQGQRDEIFREFWQLVKPRLRDLPMVKTTTGRWKKPGEAFLLGTSDEEEAIPVLESAGLDIVHQDLRPAYSLLTSSEVGVHILRLSNLATALSNGGLNQRIKLESSPFWMQSAGHRAKLGVEIEILLDQRLAPADRSKVLQQICRCAIAIAQNGDLAPPNELRRAIDSTARVFGTYGLSSFFLRPDNPKEITELVVEFSVRDGVAALEKLPSGRVNHCWEEEPESIRNLIGWFADQRAELRGDKELTSRLKRLPIWPSGGVLRPLTELAVPGNFEDPLRLAKIIDLDVLRDVRDFLVELEAEVLTISTYAATQVPLAFYNEGGPPPDTRRKLLQLLAKHIGELQDIAAVRGALASCPLVECEDGMFRTPQHVYFDTDIVKRTLGSGAPRAVLPKEYLEPTTQILRWLGVVEGPRPEDVVRRIREVIQGPPDSDRRAEIQNIFAYLGKLWQDEAIQLVQGPSLESLKSLPWLPARNDVRRWCRPAELYATYSSHLFETQGHFLDVPHPEQIQGRDLIGFLGISIEPSTSQVVNHLIACSEADCDVNRGVYTWLNQKAEDPVVLRLKGTSCLLLQDIGYKRPDQVYWGQHPFGSYRFQLPSEDRIYTPFFEKLEVRETPGPKDAVQVLQEISGQYGATNQPVDSETSAVVMQCWILLDRFLSDRELEKGLLLQLSNLKTVVDDRGMLEQPGRMFFDDRPGLAVKFKNLIQHNVMIRPLGAWRAMEAAGVRPLSQAVKTSLVECEGAVEARQMRERLHQRHHLIDRVIEANRGDAHNSWKPDILNSLRVEKASRLEVTYTLRAFSQTRTTPPEAVPVYYNHEERALFFLGEGTTPWAAIARELAHALNPDAEAAKLASGLKEVMSAESVEQASFNLDELGYPPLETPGTPTPISKPVGVGGVESVNSVEYTEPATQTLRGPTVTTPADALRSLGITNDPIALPPELQTADASSREPAHTGPRQGTGAERQAKRQRSRLRTYVVPDDKEAAEQSDDPRDERTNSVEIAGVARVMDYESEAKRTPFEMPPKFPGYDIESRSDGGVERFIEVKSVAGDWDLLGVGLSRRQFEKAAELKSNYWLYVVERAEQDDYTIYRIQDPAGKANQFFYDDGWAGLAETDVLSGTD